MALHSNSSPTNLKAGPASISYYPGLALSDSFCLLTECAGRINRRFSYIFILIILCFAANQAVASPPLTIVIGIDGLKHDAIDRVQTVHLQKMADEGIRVKRMIPQMPTKTFVNFYTLATGLYPEKHGFISNNPYDRKLARIYNRQLRTDVESSDWWKGEPIWITSEKQGIKAAIYFWVGSEAIYQKTRPSYWKIYQQEKDYSERVREVLQWANYPVHARPGLIMLYFSAVDTAAHQYGVGSSQEKAAIQKVDQHIGDLIKGLKKAKLYKNTNIIVVSDHGMVNLSDKKVIDISGIVNNQSVVIPEWPREKSSTYQPFMYLYGSKTEIERIYEKLKNRHPKLHVFKKDEIPQRFKIKYPSRTPELILLADLGWILYANNNITQPKKTHQYLNGVATHGYDNRYYDMHATFIASGPSFRQKTMIETINNIDVYHLIACTLNIEATENDGNIKNILNFLNKKNKCHLKTNR